MSCQTLPNALTASTQLHRNYNTDYIDHLKQFIVSLVSNKGFHWFSDTQPLPAYVNVVSGPQTTFWLARVRGVNFCDLIFNHPPEIYNCLTTHMR